MLRFPGWVLLAALSVGLGFGLDAASVDEPPSPAAAERERHQGAWRAIQFVYDGAETPKDIVETITRHVEGDHVVWKRDGKSFAGTKVVFDASKDPKTIDVAPDGGPDRDKVVAGIYQLEGETLTICMARPNGERPKVFEAPKGSGRTLMKFRREAKTLGRSKS